QSIMLASFLHLANVSPTRRQALRTLAGAHVALIVLLLGGMFLGDDWSSRQGLGNALLIAGIVEGSLLIGWRLTQLPKSQALEFLLVTDLQPTRVLLAEALVGIWRFAQVTLVGVPLLVALWFAGLINLFELATLIA